MTNLSIQQHFVDQSKLPAVVTVQHIRALENAITQSGVGIDLHVEHHFSAGVYARELHIPAGVVLTGRTHKKANLNILTQGDISVLVDGKIKRIHAPATIVSPAGVKRVAYAHTDCVWTTVHGTELTDVDAIAKEFLEAEPVDLPLMASAVMSQIVGSVI